MKYFLLTAVVLLVSRLSNAAVFPRKLSLDFASSTKGYLDARTYFFIGKIDIQPTYMHKYSSSLSLVPHSLIHMLIQVISHTYVTLEPQASYCDILLLLFCCCKCCYCCGLIQERKKVTVRAVCECSVLTFIFVLMLIFIPLRTYFSIRIRTRISSIKSTCIQVWKSTSKRRNWTIISTVQVIKLRNNTLIISIKVHRRTQS